MRIREIKVGDKTYPACCGLYALADIQKKYGKLDTFTNKILGKKGEDPDLDAVMYALKRFTEAGAKASGEGKGVTDADLETVTEPYALIAELYGIYIESMVPESPEVQNQTKREMENQ